MRAEYHGHLGALRITGCQHGTRFDLVVVQDPHGGLLVAWPAAGWLGRCYRRGTHWTHLAGKRPLKLDLESIQELVRQAFADGEIPDVDC